MEDKKFWSEQTWTKSLFYSRSNQSSNFTDQMNTLKIDGDYVPFCTLDILTIDSNLINRLRYREQNYSLQRRTSDNRYPCYYENFIKPDSKIKDSIYKHLDTNSHLLYLGNTDQDKLKVSKEGFGQFFDEYVNKPLDNSIIFQTRPSTRSSPKVIENVCYVPYPTIVNCTKKIGANKNYLTHYFFCAEIDNSIKAVFNSAGITTTGITPLFVMMIKKEFVPYVRACMLNNIPLNNEVLELWIDKSLDNPKSEHPFRGQFVKVIRQKCKKDGITIKVFDDLKEHIINSPKPKKFKSIMEQKNYISDKISDVLSKERIANGIVIKSEDLDKTVLGLLDNKPNFVVTNIGTNDSIGNEVEELLARVNSIITRTPNDVELDDIPF